MSRGLLLLFVLVFVLPFTLGSGAVYPTYALDFTDVSTSPSLDLDSQSDDFGSCECDLTFSACDGNCCCDSDCSSTEKSLFTECLPEGPSGSTLRTCVDKDQVSKTNIPENSGITVMDTMDGLFCVSRDNSPSKGYFFDEPSFVDYTEVNSIFSNVGSSFEETDITSASSPATTYSVGSPVVGYRNSGGTSYYTSDGYFSVPQPGFGGVCEDGVLAKFMENKDGERCVRPVTINSGCTNSELSSAYYVTDLRVGVRPSTTATGTLITPSNGIWTSGSDWSVGSFSTPVVSGSSCNNVVTEVQYVMYHDGTGIISSVVANVHAENVSIARASISQKFSVVFLPDDVSANKTRVKSGNVGYIPGLSVLAGTLKTSGTKSAILEYVDGMKVTGPSRDGSCVKENSVVKFARSEVFTCSVSVADAAALQTLCSTTPSTVLNSLTRYYVGLFGSSNANNVKEWTQFNDITAGTSVSPSWDATKKQCVGMITGVKYRFVTTFVGRVDHPQEIITGVSMTYAHGSVIFPGEKLISGTSFEMPLRISVEFVPQEEDISLITPPSPEIFPSLPRDVLYPFTSEASSSSSAQFRWTLFIVLIAFVLGMLGIL